MVSTSPTLFYHPQRLYPTQLENPIRYKYLMIKAHKNPNCTIVNFPNHQAAVDSEWYPLQELGTVQAGQLLPQAPAERDRQDLPATRIGHQSLVRQQPDQGVVDDLGLSSGPENSPTVNQTIEDPFADSDSNQPSTVIRRPTQRGSVVWFASDHPQRQITVDHEVLEDYGAYAIESDISTLNIASDSSVSHQDQLDSTAYSANEEIGVLSSPAVSPSPVLLESPTLGHVVPSYSVALGGPESDEHGNRDQQGPTSSGASLQCRGQ